MLRMLFVLVAFVVALPAAAQELRLVENWPSEDWVTATMRNVTYGRRFCAAETTTIYDQVFRIVLYEDDDAFLEILDPSWDYTGDDDEGGDPLTFLLVIDRNEVTLEGQGWDGAMTFDLIDPDVRDPLLAQLSQGHKLDVRMLNRSRVAQFSLAGAETAISSALRCWDAERAGEDYEP